MKAKVKFNKGFVLTIKSKETFTSEELDAEITRAVEKFQKEIRETWGGLEIKPKSVTIEYENKKAVLA